MLKRSNEVTYIKFYGLLSKFNCNAYINYYYAAKTAFRAAPHTVPTL